MSSLREKERAKEQQEKFQAILSALLKDEDNKYCVDCDAKGPRWASWNLGVFMCIRCAGIHRNLGVHISRVKSVNLDTWTAEQVAMMQEVGNSRGRAVYEANIPDGFRRPQSDSALEAFIRSKYEQKKYIAREWIPPKPKVPKEWLEDSKEKRRARPKGSSGAQLQLGGAVSKSISATQAPSDAATRSAQVAAQEVKAPQVKQESAPAPRSASNDLLGLDFNSPPNGHQAAAPTPQSSGNELLDLFGGSQVGGTSGAAAPTGNNDLMNGSSTEGNLFEGEGAAEEKKATTKDSIMALFGGGGGGSAAANQQQMYNIPGKSNPVSSQSMGFYSAAQPVIMPSMSNSLPHQQFNTTLSNNVSQQGQPQLSTLGVANSNQQQQFSQSISTAYTTTLVSPMVQQSGTSLVGASLAAQPTMIHQQQPQHKFNVPASQPIMKPAPISSGVTVNSSNIGKTPTPNQQQLPTSLDQAINSSNAALMTSLGYQGQGFRMAMPDGQNQTYFYGGMYMPQGQQGYPGMAGANMMGQMPNMMQGQQPNMIGAQQPNMMGYQPNMMQQQPQGMMGNPQINGAQAGMYGNAMMPGGGQGMYTPQQMQQFQFQQMQQQMAAMNMGAPAQQMPGGWGANPAAAGQTLSNNLWQ